ncbi:hypothetical protein MferCBS31731_002894 [Microsporum ferrugineum]
MEERRPASSIYSRDTFHDNNRCHDQDKLTEKDVEAARNNSTHTIDGIVHPAMRDVQDTHTLQDTRSGEPGSTVTSLSGMLKQFAGSWQHQPDLQPIPQDQQDQHDGQDYQQGKEKRRRARCCGCGFFGITLTLLVVTLLAILSLCICISAGAFNHQSSSPSSTSTSTSPSTSVKVTVQPPTSLSSITTGPSSTPTSSSTEEPKEKLSGLVPYLTFLGTPTTTQS